MYVDREYNEYCYMIIKRKSFENTFHFYFSAGFRKLYVFDARKEEKEASLSLLSFLQQYLHPHIFRARHLHPRIFRAREDPRCGLAIWVFLHYLTHERRLKFFYTCSVTNVSVVTILD